MPEELKDVEQRIRELAYYLWEQDAQPEGRDSEYWERAKELVARETPVAGGPEMASEDSPVEAAA